MRTLGDGATDLRYDDPQVMADAFIQSSRALTQALLCNEFEALSLAQRVCVFALIAELLLDCGVVRAYFKKLQRDLTRFGIAKREEYGAALKAAEAEASAPTVVKGKGKKAAKGKAKAAAAAKLEAAAAAASPSAAAAAAATASPSAAAKLEAAAASPSVAADDTTLANPLKDGGSASAPAPAPAPAGADAVVLVRKRGDLDKVRNIVSPNIICDDYRVLTFRANPQLTI